MADTELVVERGVRVKIGAYSHVDRLEISGLNRPSASSCSEFQIEIGRFASVGRDVLVDFSWDLRQHEYIQMFGDRGDPTLERFLHPSKVVVGHGAVVGARSVLAGGCVVGNCAIVLPTTHPGHGVTSFCAGPSPSYDNNLSLVLNSLRWWDNITEKRFQECSRDRERILRRLSRRWVTENIGSCVPHLANFCARIDPPLPWKGKKSVKITGDTSLFRAVVRDLVEHVAKSEGPPEVYRLCHASGGDPGDSCRHSTFLRTLLSAMGIAVEMGDRENAGEEPWDLHVLQTHEILGGVSRRAIVTVMRGEFGAFYRAGVNPARSPSPIVVRG